MVIIELRGLREVLEKKVGAVQREFTAVADRLAELRRKWSEAEAEERPQIVAEQETLKDKQMELAETVNLWRDRVRAIENPRSEQALAASLDEFLNLGDSEVAAAVTEARRLMAMDPEEKAALFSKTMTTADQTPTGRLLERARTSYDMRHGGPAVLQKEALDFSNRKGISQDDAVIAELEGKINDPDPVVADLAARTLVQVQRFRAMRSAELDVMHKATQALIQMKHPTVVSVLAEILTTPRVGYAGDNENLKEELNDSDRLSALIALVEWRTKEAQDAIRGRTMDREPQIANAAERALAAFPGEWTGNQSSGG